MAVVIEEVTAEAVEPPPQPELPPIMQPPRVDPEQVIAIWRRLTVRMERLWTD